MVTSTRSNASGRSRSQPPPGAPAPVVTLALVVAPAPVVVPAPVAPAISFIEDPYQGNINPGTDQGLKLYLNAIKPVEEDQRMKVSISQAKSIRATLEELSNQFGWAQLVHNISDNNGNRKSIFRDIKQLKVSNIHPNWPGLNSEWRRTG